MLNLGHDIKIWSSTLFFRRNQVHPCNGWHFIQVYVFHSYSCRCILFTLTLQSEEDGDWWLYFGHDINNLSAVGYWPNRLLPNMQDHAAFVSWNGETGTNGP